MELAIEDILPRCMYVFTPTRGPGNKEAVSTPTRHNICKQMLVRKFSYRARVFLRIFRRLSVRLNDSRRTAAMKYECRV